MSVTHKPVEGHIHMPTGISDTALSARRIAITGAGRGLGRSLAIAAADAGANVVLLGRSMDSLHSVAATILTRTRRAADVVHCDLADPRSVRTAAQAVLAENPTLDVLINNGAPWLTGRLAESSEADIVATIAAAVTGTMLMTRGLLPGLLRSEAADIVTIVSTAALPGRDFDTASSAFHAAKHGQAGFCDRLRAELKPQGVRVAAIFPPDFDEVDPEATHPGESTTGARLNSRDVVRAVMFAITASRACAIPTIVLENMVESRPAQ